MEGQTDMEVEAEEVEVEEEGEGEFWINGEMNRMVINEEYCIRAQGEVLANAQDRKDFQRAEPVGNLRTVWRASFDTNSNT